MGLGAACMYQGSRSMGDEISCQMSLPSFLELLVRLLLSLSIPVDALSALSIPKLFRNKDHADLRCPATASAYLEDAPANLTIKVNSPVAKLLISGNKAIGVRTIAGSDFHAKHEVILSGGALNTPQVLMLSGIGPAAELKKHGISVIQDLPQVGKNLQDHCFSTATLLQHPGTDDRAEFEAMSPEAMAATRAQHTKDKRGVLSSLYCSVPSKQYISLSPTPILLPSYELQLPTRSHLSPLKGIRD
jgi:choline dehydrogenase-like flavoprotein